MLFCIRKKVKGVLLGRTQEWLLDCVGKLNVFDVRYSGIFFTWAQKPTEEGGIFRKLDRVMINSSFHVDFESFSGQFVPRGVSNHSPEVMSVDGGKNRGMWSFKFDNFLSHHLAFYRQLNLFGTFGGGLLCI